MFGKRSVLPRLLPGFFWAVACATLAVAQSSDNRAETDRLVVRGVVADFVLTLSGGCTLRTTRLPDRQLISQFDAGECDERAVVRSADRGTLYVGSRNGTIEALSLPGLQATGRRHIAGGAVRQMLATSDGRYLIATIDGAPATMAVLHGASLTPARVISLQDRHGQPLTGARLAGVAHRHSVLITFEHSNEFWEMFLAANAEPVYDGLVHDYRMGEGISEPRNLPIRRILADAPMQQFMIEARGAHLAQWVVERDGSSRVLRFNLDIRRAVNESPLPAGADPTGARGFRTQRISYWLAPDLDWPGLHILALPAVQDRRFLDLPGEHCRVMSPPGTGLFLIAACRIDHADHLFIVDPVTGRLGAVLRPMAGRRVSQVAYSAGAGFLVASMAGETGALVVYAEDCRCRTGVIAVSKLRKVVD